MKKVYTVFLLAAISTLNLLAGGIMTNTNQSASYIRMPARDASLGVDAVYYNPAGLTRLSDGFHFSINNQVILQTRTIDNEFPLLNSNSYNGDVTAPLFPSIYGVYKTGKFAFSGGFMPVGGGGAAEYPKGLPSFETTYASIPAMLTAQGITTTSYDVDIFFEGSSIFFGGQLGVSYQLNDMVDVFGGVRYVSASNSYNGYLKNIMINPVHMTNPGGGMVNANGFFTNLSGIATAVATGIQPIIDGGAGSLTLDQAVAMDIIDQATATQIAAGLGASYSNTMTISQVQGEYQVSAATAAGLADQLINREVDAKQNGFAIAPVFGVNLQFSEKFNVGIKYEFITKLELENDTEIDQTGMFPDGAKTRSDMPAMLSIGAAYKATPKLNIAGGLHYFFDRSADYGKSLPNDQIIDNNFIELALGVEYDLTNNLLVSGGYLRTITGVNEKYHSDLSHSLSTHTIGAGGRYAVNDMIGVNLGFLVSIYDKDSKQNSYDPPFTSITETYDRKNMVFAIGVDFKF